MLNVRRRTAVGVCAKHLEFDRFCELHHVENGPRQVAYSLHLFWYAKQGKACDPVASSPTTKDDAMKFRQALIGFASLLGAASAHAIVDPNSHYDNANEFSIAANPNGVWSYGYSSTLGGAFNAFTTSASASNGLQSWFTPSVQDLGTPLVYRNASLDPISIATATIGGLEAGFHPGPTTLAIFRFTAPTAGSYFVEASFFTHDSNATGVDVHVLQDGSSALFSAPLAHSGAETFTFWSGAVSLASGSTLDFAVSNAGNYFYDSTGLGVQIAAVPEPQTYVLLGIGLGLVGFASRRRRS